MVADLLFIGSAIAAGWVVSTFLMWITELKHIRCSRTHGSWKPASRHTTEETKTHTDRGASFPTGVPSVLSKSDFDTHLKRMRDR